MVHDNHLSSEANCFHCWVVFAVTSNVATTIILDRHILGIETHIVPRKSFIQSFMVHFDRFYFSCNVDWSKGDHHTGLRTPVSTRPTGTVPIPPILRVGGRMQSRASSSVVPLALPSLRVTFRPLNQGMLALGSSMVSPFQPETVTNTTVSGL
uniref:Uncharacterized protein n=1 Tax=Papio anubis TaxID=9555 RepID=A0A8I5NKA4_PAPAN